MKAIGFNQPLPISDARSLVDLDLPDPEYGEQDLLVEVQAIAVNPADTKVRASAKPAAGTWRSATATPACARSNSRATSGLKTRAAT